MDSAPLTIADPERLLADLRKGDETAIAQAYRHVFAGPIGRFVLLHQLADAGVGALRGHDLGGEARGYHDGRGDHALTLLARAGYDQFSAAVAVAAETLEGQDHDGHDHGNDPGPRDEFGGADPNPDV